MRAVSNLSRTALVLLLSLICLSPLGGQMQQSVRPIRVLVLYWDEKEHLRQ